MNDMEANIRDSLSIIECGKVIIIENIIQQQETIRKGPKHLMGYKSDSGNIGITYVSISSVLSHIAEYNDILSYYLKQNKKVKKVSSLIMYCIEHCVLSYSLCRKPPSLIASACFVYSCLSTKTISMNTFENHQLSKIIGYGLSDLVPPMRQIHEIVRETRTSRWTALYRKHSNPSEYCSIAKLNFSKSETSFLF